VVGATQRRDGFVEEPHAFRPVRVVGPPRRPQQLFGMQPPAQHGIPAAVDGLVEEPHGIAKPVGVAVRLGERDRGLGALRVVEGEVVGRP
jgi:hypothetical protein